MENTSGQGKFAVAPPEVRGWNWGAFFFNWLWGIFNNTFIALLCFIPIVNIIMMFVLGAKGNEWAWQNKRWNSIEQFKRVQKNWAVVGSDPFYSIYNNLDPYKDVITVKVIYFATEVFFINHLIY